MQTATDDPVVIRRTLQDLFGERNARLIDNTASAYSVMLQLVDDGHQVIDLHVGNGNPLITIAYSPLVHQWRSVTSKRITHGGQPLRCQVAIIKGVQIQWYDRSH